MIVQRQSILTRTRLAKEVKLHKNPVRFFAACMVTSFGADIIHGPKNKELC